jgi:hypothetical protein
VPIFDAFAGVLLGKALMVRKSYGVFEVLHDSQHSAAGLGEKVGLSTPGMEVLLGTVEAGGCVEKGKPLPEFQGCRTLAHKEVTSSSWKSRSVFRLLVFSMGSSGGNRTTRGTREALLRILQGKGLGNVHRRNDGSRSVPYA